MSKQYCRCLLQVVAELHRRGYGLLRIRPGLSASGCSWRCNIVTHGKKRGSDLQIPCYSSSLGAKLFGWDDAEGKSVPELADLFEARFPNLCSAAKGVDRAYVEWFTDMLLKTAPNSLPIDYADYDLPTGCQPTAPHTAAAIPLPPPVKTDPAASSLSESVIARAQGCMLGQLAGDSLGSLVEFCSSGSIADRYSNGLEQLASGGTWQTLAGQPTDDSEMALMLARSLVKEGEYNAAKVKQAYCYWLNSNPFDCGNTVAVGLRGEADRSSQANGALMRISPLGIFGCHASMEQVAAWAVEDAMLTHPHPICQQANALFAMAIAYAVRQQVTGRALYQQIVVWSEAFDPMDDALKAVIASAEHTPPSDYMIHQGWVLVAFHNALWQLLHSPSLQAGVVDSVARGGDTDTNAAICGALLGAVYGVDSVPQQWRDAIAHCRPDSSNPAVKQPRPPCFWPCDAEELAVQLTSIFHSH